MVGVASKIADKYLLSSFGRRSQNEFSRAGVIFSRGFNFTSVGTVAQFS
jgi:hypothetical protein